MTLKGQTQGHRLCFITLKAFTLDAQFVLDTDWKSYMGFQMVVWPMMLHELERSNSRSQISVAL